MRAAAVLVALAACGDNIATIPFDEYNHALRDANCARLTACGVFTDTSQCDRYFRDIANRDLVDAVRAGKVRYDGIAGTACVASISAAGCNTTSEDVRRSEGCDAALRGTLPKGADCTFDLECASGACNAPSCTMECCRGTCVDAEPRVEATIAIGGMCREDRECVFGAACVGAGIDPGFCRTLPLAGEMCPYNRCAEVGVRCDLGMCVGSGIGAPCTNDLQCSEFNLCDLPTQRCAAVPTLGMACETICAGASWCDHDAPQPTCAGVLSTGTPCRTSDQCETLVCKEGEMFDTCVEPEPCF